RRPPPPAPRSRGSSPARARSPRPRTGARPDVLDACLIVEGTYPYATGAASAWVADLVSGLSTLRFGVVHVGRGRDGPHQATSPAWHATHAPVLDLLRTRVPRAALYHAIGTGPAALLASLAAFATGAPLLVTEPDDPRPAPPPGPIDAAFVEAIRGFARRTAY